MLAAKFLAAGVSQYDWPFNNRAVNGSKLSTTFRPSRLNVSPSETKIVPDLRLVPGAISPAAAKEPN